VEEQMASKPPPSQKPILEKLLLKPGYRAVVLNAPASYQPVLADAPPGVELADALEGQFDFIHYFVKEKADLQREGPRLKAALKPKGLLWVSYPKGKALGTDLNRDVAAAMLQEMGLQGVAQVAIDDTWSALRFKRA
jgi:hypothetical protein